MPLCDSGLSLLLPSLTALPLPPPLTLDSRAPSDLSGDGPKHASFKAVPRKAEVVPPSAWVLPSQPELATLGDIPREDSAAATVSFTRLINDLRAINAAIQHLLIYPLLLSTVAYLTVVVVHAPDAVRQVDFCLSLCHCSRRVTPHICQVIEDLLFYVRRVQIATGGALAICSVAAAHFAESPPQSSQLSSFVVRLTQVIWRVRMTQTELLSECRPRMTQTELLVSAAVGVFLAHFHLNALSIEANAQGASAPYSDARAAVDAWPQVLVSLWGALMRAACSRGRYALVIGRNQPRAKIAAPEARPPTLRERVVKRTSCLSRARFAFTRTIIIFNMTEPGLAVVCLAWLTQALLILLGASVAELVPASVTTLTVGAASVDGVNSSAAAYAGADLLTAPVCSGALSSSVCKALRSQVSVDVLEHCVPWICSCGHIPTYSAPQNVPLSLCSIPLLSGRAARSHHLKRIHSDRPLLVAYHGED